MNREATRCYDSAPMLVRERMAKATRALDRCATPQRVLVTSWMLFLVYAFPGYMSYDSGEQLAQARGIEPITNWHPPLMAYLWRITDHIIAGPLPMLIIQSVVFMWGVNSLLRRVLSKRAAAIATGAILLAPPVIAPMAVIWKDCQMAAFLIAGIAVMTRTTRRAQLLGCFLVFLATAQRYNAAAATLPVMLGLFVWREGLAWWKRYTIAFGAWLALTGMAVAVSAALVQQKKDVFDSLALYDIAGSIRYHRHYDDADVRRDLPGLPWVHPDKFQIRTRRIYAANINSLVLTGPDGIFTMPKTEAQRAAVVAAWRTLIRTNPLGYLRHRLGIFLTQLRITHRDSFYIWGGFYDSPFRQQQLHIDGTHSAIQTAWFDALVWISDTPIFWAWVYLLLAFVLLPLCRRDRVAVTILTSGIACELGLFIVAPAVDFRYSHWMVVCTIVAGVTYLGSKARDRRTRRDGSSCAGGRRDGKGT